MNPSQDFNQLYSNVSGSIASAMTQIADLKVEHKEGKQEISSIMEKLRDIQARFDGELSLLEEHAEWDKFTMAFFGETNAGKSTIIESLRILFKEESRQELLLQNAHDLAKYEQVLVVHVNQALTKVLQEESSGRIQRKLWLMAIGGLSVGSAVAVAITRLMGLT